jgi:hypothetical protein
MDPMGSSLLPATEYLMGCDCSSLFIPPLEIYYSAKRSVT